MLEPHSRQLLRDALRPPPGYALDRAITTTFSLDLMALLTIPVSFTVFQLRDHDGPPAVDPLALLESLRRHAGRLTVFCQAGQIHIPRQVQLLLGYLEDSVYQVRTRPGGVFHPKLTVLRYAAERPTETAGASVPAVVYRVLCSSRNLTFDRSWDTLLALDGPLAAHRSNAFARNRPLSRFVDALPGLGIHPMAPARVAEVRAMADELLRVDFELPPGFDELEFCPLGIDGVADPAAARWPVLRHRRTLAMAPFVDEGFVRRFREDGQPLELISRAEALDELSLDALGNLTGAWYMNTAADPIPDGPGPEPADAAASADSSDAPGPESDVTAQADQTEVPAADGDAPILLGPTVQLHGLHAKVFVADDGWKAHIYTGSANATTAAFERNVEFLVRLTGKKSKYGVDGLLGRSGDGGETDGTDSGLTFADLLVRYQRDTGPVVDETRKSLERLLDDARYALATAKISAHAEDLPAAGSDGASARFRVVLMRSAEEALGLPEAVTVTCYPLTLKPDNAVSVRSPVGPPVAMFEPLSFEALTSFYAFGLTARHDGAELSSGFVLNVPLTGAPADRHGRLLLALLKNREQLLRYLLLLLADDEADARRLAEAFGADDQNAHAAGAGGGFGLPLLEPLLQALDRRPSRLDQIARLIDDLRKTSAGRDLVSDEFLTVWDPIWAAKEGLTRG